MSADIKCNDCDNTINDVGAVKYSKTSNKTLNIFRFKFTDAVALQITNFSKVHQYDDRHEYKKNWEEWLEENKELVSNEERRLIGLGYDKCVKDKMFKAGRYYFRKKGFAIAVSVKRRVYISISHAILEAMVAHISNHINDINYTPANGYDCFCETHTNELTIEIQNIIKQHSISVTDLASKIKKTYKNRYFIISRS